MVALRGAFFRIQTSSSSHASMFFDVSFSKFHWGTSGRYILIYATMPSASTQELFRSRIEARKLSGRQTPDFVALFAELGILAPTQIYCSLWHQNKNEYLFSVTTLLLLLVFDIVCVW